MWHQAVAAPRVWPEACGTRQLRHRVRLAQGVATGTHGAGCQLMVVAALTAYGSEVPGHSRSSFEYMFRGSDQPLLSPV